MAKRFPQVTKVIFDVDGLLLDTERLYLLAALKVCSEYGKKYTRELKAKVMGKSEKEATRIVVDYLQLPIQPEEYKEKVRAEHMKTFPSVALLPGAETLVRHLHKHNIPMAVASGSSNWSYNLKTASHKELFSLFSHAVLCGDDPDVKAGKPHPDCFLVAARRFGDNPDVKEILIFEDAPNGVEAASAAGMPCVCVPGEWTDRSDVTAKSTIVLDSLELFRPEDFGLPSYGS
ncbi:hypothetical protein ScPMuIL_018111 [Solemya velum]